MSQTKSRKKGISKITQTNRQDFFEMKLKYFDEIKKEFRLLISN